MQTFGMSELAAARKSLGHSQEQFTGLIGLKSKGHLSQIERGAIAPSVRTAIAIERATSGRVKAGDLNSDVALVEAFVSERATSS